MFINKYIICLKNKERDKGRKKNTWSCKKSSKLRLEKVSSTGTIMEESSSSIWRRESTTNLLFWSPIISGKEPMISFFKCRGQIDNTCNSFSVKDWQSTRKSSHRNWLRISNGKFSSIRRENDPWIASLVLLSKNSGSFSSNVFWTSTWIDSTNKSIRIKLSLLTEPVFSQCEGSKTL